MMKKTLKWIGYDFYYGHYDNPPREGTDENDEMKQFFRDFRSDLKAALKPAGMKVIHMKKNYYDVTAVVGTEDGSKLYYVSLGDMRCNPHWNERVLIRTMAHEKDWTGGANHYCSCDNLVESLQSLR